MKRWILATSAATLVLASLLAGSLQAAVITLFEDDFSAAVNNSIEEPGSTHYDVGDETTAWAVLDKVYHAGGAVKLASEQDDGVMVTTNLFVQAGLVEVSLRGVGWDASERTFTIKFGGQTRTLTCDNDRSAGAAGFKDFSEAFEVQAGMVSLTIRATKNKRVIIDDVLITQDQVDDPLEPAFLVDFATPSTVQETYPVAFSIRAEVRGSLTNVILVTDLPAGAGYTVTNWVGYFAWIPALGQAGEYPLAFTALGANGQTYTNTVVVTVNTLPLVAPQNLTVSTLAFNGFDLSWEEVRAATEGYVVSVWTGSGAMDTPASDAEPFYAIAAGGPIVAPYGWTFTNIKEKYASTDFVELKFRTVGDTIVTKTYPKPVTSLTFHLRGRSTETNASTIIRVYGTSDEVTWTELQTYNTLADDDGDPENNIFTSGNHLVKTLTFGPASGYRRFKFVNEVDERGNVGIGKIAVVYEGCGTRFVGDWNEKATTSLSAVVEGARPCRDYYVSVGACNGQETKYSFLGLTTPPASPGTLIIVK